ncbi:MAG TPA: hypothetical protein PLU24_05105, partial [Candidatus Omnitrophota bacterium]|nr:hypothetical protein [Candidatus Omnitrophota bacterium]
GEVHQRVLLEQRRPYQRKISQHGHGVLGDLPLVGPALFQQHPLEQRRPYQRKNKIRLVIRGLRMLSDFEYEFQMALTNRKFADEVETVFLMPSEEYSYVSSKLLREAAGLGADLSNFLPSSIEVALKKKLKQEKK